MDECEVVTAFLRNRGAILLCHHSEEGGFYQGKWDAIAGHAEGDPDATVEKAIREKTGIDPETSCQLVRAGNSFTVEDRALDRRWIVHSYLFDCQTRDVESSWESSAVEWVSPPEILRRETVPRLWRAYQEIRPTVETVETDTEHGSAYLSLRALEVLRDEAALQIDGAEAEYAARYNSYDSISAVGHALLDARPAMAVVVNRINRVLYTTGVTDAKAVEKQVAGAIERAIEADTAAATKLAARTEGRRVATLSRSGTVRQALEEGTPDALLIAASRPGGEGIGVAETFADQTDVTLSTDAAFGSQLEKWDTELLVVGADTLFADGAVLNKVGTCSAASVATAQGIPVLVAAGADKISPERQIDVEPRPAEELYDGTEPITVANPTFDVTPPTAIDTILTERGEYEPDELDSLAQEYERYAGWS